MMNKLSTVAALMLTVFLLSACSDSATTDPTDPGNDSTGYPYVIQSMNTDLSGFIGAYDSIPSGMLDVSANPNSKQLTRAWSTLVHGHYLYSGYNSIGEPGIQKYSVGADGKLKDEGFISTGSFPNICIVDETHGYYCDTKRDKQTIQTFNPSTMLRTGQIDLSHLTRGFPWETTGLRNLIYRNGKLFADLNFSNSTSGYGDDAVDSCEFAVINTSTNTFEKHIVMPGVRGSGYVNAVGYHTFDGNGDVYVISFGNLFGERNSHIVRIKAGTDDFDPSYIIKVDDLILDGLFLNLHIWNDRLFVLASTEVVLPDFSNFSTDIFHWYEVNKTAKTISLVPGLPVSNFTGQQNPVTIDGKLYFPCNNTTSSAYYMYDGTNPATKAIEFTAGAGVGFYKVN